MLITSAAPDTAHHALHSPFTVAVAAAAAVIVLIVVVNAANRRRPVRKDTQRVFTAQQRFEMFQRAGNRCEHKPMLWLRCTDAPTHGDHIYPHSKGGLTIMSNAAALCARHNLAKGALVPSSFAIVLLQRRRRKYFPPGVPVKVRWK
jgi:hypothetical protein